MKKRGRWKKLFGFLYHYCIFFILAAFTVTCTLLLFLNTLAADIGVTFTEDNIQRAAKLGFLNVIILSVIFTAFDIVRRRMTTDRVTRRIGAAAEQIVAGNFAVRISPVTGGAGTQYNEIIANFNQMASELQSVETLRTDFVANVSHEMKTPLAVIQNYGTLLQTPGLSEEKRLEYARGIIDGVHRMSDMMTNILKLNRLENQKIYHRGVTFDLGEQLCEALLQYESVWEKLNIDIETDISENVQIQADRELLTLVWNNLLSNAFKFTPEGGKVSLFMTADTHYATVQVTDTGCGMTAEVGAHIFEKFYQGDTSHSCQGNGLGLALVKRVMDILQGEISVESTLGVGSTFTVKLRRD